ncbi:MAG: hypothetical protein RL033_3602, partial [Pseudomonadota bacterium]
MHDCSPFCPSLPFGRCARAAAVAALVGIGCGELSAPDTPQIPAVSTAQGVRMVPILPPVPVPPSAVAPLGGLDNRAPPQTPEAAPTPIAGTPPPAAVADPGAGRPPAFRAGTGSVTDVAAGFDHSCALLDTGQVRCWGDGDMVGDGGAHALLAGQLVGDHERPASVGFVDLGEPAKQLSAGFFHTCALLDSGAIRCWGENAHGNLGILGYDGSYYYVGDDESPTAIPPVNIDGPVDRVFAGSESNCALLLDGTLRCWGLGPWARTVDELRLHVTPLRGSVADATEGTYYSIGFESESEDVIASPLRPPDPRPTPVRRIDFGERVTQVAMSMSHVCVLLQTGQVRCWGSGADGRLGYGNSADIESPEAAADVDIGGPVAQLAAGSSQTCAVLQGGSVRCWGYGLDGRLGYGRKENVGDDETPAAAGDVDVGGAVRSIGMQGSLVCVLLETGTVRCWGPGFGFHPLSAEPGTQGDAGAQSDADLAKDAGAQEQGYCDYPDERVPSCPGYVGAQGYGKIGALGDEQVPAAAGDVQL